MSKALEIMIAMLLSIVIFPLQSMSAIEELEYDPTYGTMKQVYEDGIISDQVINIRRYIHKYPGVMYEEYEAAGIVYETLRSIGIEEHNIQTGLAITGVIAHIGAGSLDSTLKQGPVYNRTGEGSEVRSRPSLVAKQYYKSLLNVIEF